MTFEDSGRLIRVLKATYPSYKPESIRDAVEVWTALFSGEDAELVFAALYTYMKEPHEFAPSPGQLNEIIQTLQGKDSNPVGVFLQKVHKAATRSTYYFDEEFEKFTETEQLALGDAHYLRDLSMREDGVNWSVEDSLLTKRYNKAVEDAKRIAAMPSEYKEMLLRLAADKTAARIEDKGTNT